MTCAFKGILAELPKVIVVTDLRGITVYEHTPKTVTELIARYTQGHTSELRIVDNTIVLKRGSESVFIDVREILPWST